MKSSLAYFAVPMDQIQGKLTVFAWLWLVAGADLVWENNTIGWLADKPNEQSDNIYRQTH